jgi:hypothetical protein
LSSPSNLVGNFPQIWRVEDHEPADLKFYKELDSALVKAGLPHILDILSVTDAVNAMLETKVADKSMYTILYGIYQNMKNPTYQSVPGLTRLFGRLIGAYAKFRQ